MSPGHAKWGVVFRLNSFYRDLQVHGAIKTLKCSKVRAKDHPTAPHGSSSWFEILLGPHGCCRVSHAARAVGIRGKLLLLRNRCLKMHVGPSMCKGKFGPLWSAPQRLKIWIQLLHV